MLNLFIREKLTDAVLYLVNINDEYLKYMTSEKRAKDLQNNTPSVFSFNPGFTIRSKENQSEVF